MKGIGRGGYEKGIASSLFNFWQRAWFPQVDYDLYALAPRRTVLPNFSWYLFLVQYGIGG